MLTPREIIAEAWKITLTEKSLRRWGLFGSFFELLLDVKLWIYQVYFMYEFLAGNTNTGFFDVEILLYKMLPLWFFVTIIIAFIILFAIELIVPSLTAGAIIGLAAKSHNKQPTKGGMVLALYNFFPILALHEIFVLSGFSTMVTAASISFRYSDNLGPILVGVIVALWALSNFFKFFANFAEEAVVIDKLGIYGAGAKSVKLVISNLKHMVFLLMLMLIISIRIVLNAIALLVIPSIVVGIGLLLTSFVTPVVSYVIASIIGLILIFVASYFFAYLHVFKQTVWTITYIELKKERELDKVD